MKTRLQTELHHFKQLTFEARQLLISSTVYEFAYPLLFVFLSAFLFRNTGTFTASVLFNVGLFIGLPVAFYGNGLLLKKFPMKWLFAIGLIGQGLVAGSVFFFNHVSLLTIFLVGFLQAIPMGLYWANRNFINISVTDDEKRGYYTGLETIVGNIAGVISPFITGWTLVLAPQLTGVSIQQVYQLLAVVVTIGLGLASVTLSKMHVANPAFTKLWLGRIHSPWNKGRVRELICGLENGFKLVVPALLVLYALGAEGTLGTVQSVAAIVSSVLIYVLARKIAVHHRKNLLFVSVICNIVITLPLSFFFTQFSVVFYLITYATVHQLLWMALYPMQFQLIDQEEGGDPTNNYSYVVDKELFLNTGRLLGLGIFLAALALSSNEIALRVITLVIAISQIGLLFLV